MYKGAVFFDYDGTITDENDGIYSPTERTLYTFEHLRANGYATFLATGRMKPLTTLVSGKFTGLVTSNGAYTEIEGKCINNIYLDRELQKEAISYMESENIFYALETQTGAYTNGLDNKHFLDILNHFKLARSLYHPISQAPDLSANKMIITYEDEEKAVRMSRIFEGRLTIKPHRFCLSADLDAAGITKATGIEAVSKHLGIPKENIYAIGDGSNDVTMLRAAGHGIAMANHSKLLDGEAEFYTKSVREDGIYHAICEHYGLI
ncbi:MAG: HAD family phosphatase [Clostridia bacterium]|nr:HAD family phosphatase [Clostridia bacterium]